MATLGFLPENITPEKADYALFEQLWSMMDGENSGGVTKEDFSYVLQIIRGINWHEREVDVEAQEGKEGIDKQVVFGERGNL